MGDRVRPEEAARALDEIGRQQEQVIRLTIVPTWFWWAIAGLMVAFVVAVENWQDHGLVIGIASAVFVAGVLGTTGWVVYLATRRARVRNDLMRPRGVLAILGFVALADGLAMALTFGLDAAGVPYPATVGVSAAALLMVVGGPLLTRYVYGLMLANRPGSRR